MSQHLIVYLMRGLPGSGKSHRAKRIAQPKGIVLETDCFFYRQDGENRERYEFDESRLPEARRWVFEQFIVAMEKGISPIVIDRGNGLNHETCQFVLAALERNYQVEIAEPDSLWWIELRILLKYKDFIASELLDLFAEQLARKTKREHNVPKSTIRQWMNSWQSELKVNDILANYPPP